MKKILVTLLFITIACSLHAQSIEGAWYGLLKLPTAQLHLVFHFTKTGDTYTATMDSPDQNANGLPVDKVDVAQNSITITAAKFGITYTGTYLPDSNKIKGTFTQGPGSLPLDLTRTPVAASVEKRPQDPTDFPYKQEEVKFTNPKAGDVLAGTLTMPANGKAKKLVILITGSGPQNRNEELVPFNQRPFLVWSDWLTRQGIAVLRYDDRGIAKSTGTFGTATTADFADDVIAAINYIQSRVDLKNLEIGLLGHSEGGIIAPMVAASNKNVKFVVMVAGPGIPIKELMIQQNADHLRLLGAPDTVIALSRRNNTAIYNTVIQYASLPDEEFKQKADSVFYTIYPKSEQGVKAANESAAQLAAPWSRYFINLVPADYLVKVKCPVLAIDGTLDFQVKGDDNLKAINNALQAGGNKNFETVLLPGLNHLMQKAITGSDVEYGQIPETVNLVALKKVSDWINGLQ
jgi:pimeloyl-ACP methyl ester carboxylesterase